MKLKILFEMSVLMLFTDGIGIGEFAPKKNPLARFPSVFFPEFKDRIEESIPFGGMLVPTDPSMGVAGLPQSATGQTALLTGESSSRILGRHQPGFPTATLRKLLAENSIFLKLEKRGKVATFANAFTPEYFERSDRKISATTWSLKASNFPFRMVKPDLWDGRAISHDLTNEFLSTLGYDIPIRTPEVAAEILAQITETVDFCLFEYFLTDMVGHSQDMLWAEREITKLTLFLDRLLNSLNLDEHTVLLTSDHGNFEDLSVATHTNNFVPTIVWGRGNGQIANKIERIEDVPQTILTHLTMT